MEQWLSPILSTIFGGAVTAYAAVKVLESRMKDHDRRMRSIERKHGDLEDKFVTRREFRIFVDNVHRDLTNISTTLKAIRDFLMTSDKGFVSEPEDLETDRSDT